MEVIKEREDIEIWREDDVVYKVAKTLEGKKELTQEAKILRGGHLQPYVPILLEAHWGDKYVSKLRTRYIEGSEPVQDGYAFTRRLIHMLWTFQQRGIQHGDLTSCNIKVVNDYPIVFDWGEAVLEGDGRKPKRSEGDAYHLWNWARSLKDGSRIARRWFAMRERVVNSGIRLDSFMDIGCYHGDVAAAAALDFNGVVGVDSDRLAIQHARHRYGFMKNLQFDERDAVALPGLATVVSCLSTFPYILRRHGLYEAQEFVKRCIFGSEMFFFESQLRGDGPGPDFFPDTASVLAFLREMCGDEKDVEQIVEIALPDRDTTRTVFKVC